MVQARQRLTKIAGAFFRIAFEHDAERVLSGVATREGRYHHDAEPALYMSNTPEWAWKAVESYVRLGDASRIVSELHVSDARVVDIRDQDLCRDLGIIPSDSDVPWQPQLSARQRPSTWNVSDRARQAGADGLVYTARTAPLRWHLVLFKWNELGGPRVILGNQTPLTGPILERP
ncbi:MAG: RES domain-containing protein [Sphingobacteriales bacterium]|nr:MAG: RES domain-containing protein [Sphingobacteriales bacterium]